MMSIFNHERLTNQTFKLDAERMRAGWYSDKYFENIELVLGQLAAQKYAYSGQYHRLPGKISPENIEVGDIEVEMQWFTRHPGTTVVVGIDKALTMLRLCTGYFKEGVFIDTHDHLKVWALHDGSLVNYADDPMQVQPVLRVQGRYREFGRLETPTLGIMTRASRVATNVYETLVAARGKPVLFFPARFDLHEVQAADGYAYDIAVKRFNYDYAQTLRPFISTDAQGDWWGGAGGGTIPHAAIACFLGDTVETMCAFASTLPPEVPRIALVDFNNDTIQTSLAVCQVMFERFREMVDAGKPEEAKKYILYGVRLDTSGSLRDISVPPLGDPDLDMGVNPRLVFITRQALNSAWKKWGLPEKWAAEAEAYCQNVKIVVSGGFDPKKIQRFEHLNVPVDIYGVGSSLFRNAGPAVTDFTADVVRVKVHDQWIDMAKVGRTRGENPELERVW
jgi:nicotinate phosphoribosyltransferase